MSWRSRFWRPMYSSVVQKNPSALEKVSFLTLNSSSSKRWWKPWTTNSSCSYLKYLRFQRWPEWPLYSKSSVCFCPEKSTLETKKLASLLLSSWFFNSSPRQLSHSIFNLRSESVNEHLCFLKIGRSWHNFECSVNKWLKHIEMTEENGFQDFLG